MCEQLPCVCDICNCGRHKCPHKLKCPGPWDKCILSEYNRSFIPHELCPVESQRPLYKPFLGEGPLSSDTTHRVDYIPWDSQPPKSFKPNEYMKPDGVMDDMTMYRKEFGPKESCPPISVRPIPSRAVPAKFQGETTNRSDFRNWDLPQRIIHNPDVYVPNCNKFEGIGSYERDYIPHCVAPTESCRPTMSFMQSKEPMSQDTDYRQAYIPHPIEAKPPKKEPCYSKGRTPLESLTTHKKEFTPKEICKVKSCKPPSHFMQGDKPLSDETTHRTDYRNPDAEKPFKYSRGPYIKPDGLMDLNTTYNKDYINLQGCRSFPIKPPMHNRILAPFQTSTNYTDSYKKYDIPPVKAIKRDCFEPSTDPFDGCTTSKTAFVPHDICRVKSFKPPPLIPSDLPFDDATMYRSEFTKKNPPCCPAMYLNTNTRSVSPDGYSYHCEDYKGHLHYRRGSVPSSQPTNQNASNSNELLQVEANPTLPVVPMEA